MNAVAKVIAMPTAVPDADELTDEYDCWIAVGLALKSLDGDGEGGAQ